MRDVAARAAVSLGSTTYHFADRDELIITALRGHTEHVTAVATGPAAAKKAVTAVYTDRDSAVVCAEIRLHAVRDPRAAELADRVHDSLSDAVATTGGRRRARAAELVATLNTTAVDTARAYPTPTAYARAMRTHLDAALSG